ncbi:MAG: hypothetical protein RBQ91_01815 [Acholeplasma sp.]|nr:hypothetical protein [Acholeplasma sp.]
MRLLKITIHQLLSYKARALITLTSVIMFCSLCLFSLTDIKVNYEARLLAIKDMPKNQVILNRGLFLKNMQSLAEKKVVYSSVFGLSTGQSITIDVVSDDFYIGGIPVQTSGHQGYLVTDDVEVLHGSLSFEEIDNPIVLDQQTSLKRFMRENSIGSKMILIIDDTPIEFEVAAVIKDTREASIYKEYLIETNQYVEGRVLNSRAFIMEKDFLKYSVNPPRYEYAQVIFDHEVQTEDVKALFNDLGVDYDAYTSRIGSYNEYHDEISSMYKNAILSNIFVIGIVLIAFIVIFVLNLLNSLQKIKTDISYMKTIGINQKTQYKLIVLSWILLITGGFILSYVGMFIFFRVNNGSSIWHYFNYYNLVSLCMIVLLLILTLMIVLPATKRFLNKVHHAKHKMGIET